MRSRQRFLRDTGRALKPQKREGPRKEDRKRVWRSVWRTTSSTSFTRERADFFPRRLSSSADLDPRPRPLIAGSRSLSDPIRSGGLRHTGECVGVQSTTVAAVCRLINRYPCVGLPRENIAV